MLLQKNTILNEKSLRTSLQLFFLRTPLRSVGTRQGLQSLSLGAERNKERRENGCNGQNRITTTQRVHPQQRI